MLTEAEVKKLNKEFPEGIPFWFLSTLHIRTSIGSSVVVVVNDLADLGVTKPVVPGIMPCTNIAQVERMAVLSGAAFPGWLRERLESGTSPEDVRRIGVEAATELCAQLLSAGAPGLHFYTLNKSTATREIYAQLGLPVA